MRIPQLSNDPRIQAFLRKGAIGTVLLQGGLTLITLLCSVLIANMGGDKGLGIYTVVFTWIQVLSVPSVLGTDDLMVKELALQQNDYNPALMRQTILWSQRVVWIASLTVSAILLVVVNFTNWLGLHDYAFYFNIAVTAIPMYAAMHTTQAALRGMQQVSQGQIAEKFVKPIVLLLILVVFWFSGQFISNERMIIANLVSFMMAWGVAVALLWRFLRKMEKPAVPVIHKKPLPSKEWLRVCRYFASLALLQMLAQRIDILMLSTYMHDHPESIGHYNIALKWAEFLLIPFVMMNTITSPLFAKMYGAGELVEMRQLFRRTRWIQFGLTLAMGVCMVSVGGIVIGWLYGKVFEVGYQALVILCIGQAFYSFFGPVGYLLMMTGYERVTLWLLLVSVAFAAAANMLLIPIWGINGCAVSVLIGYASYQIPLAIYARKKLGV